MNLTYQDWKKRQRGRSIYLVVAVLGFSVSLGGGYYYFYRPWARRRRLQQSEEFANILLKAKKQ